MQVRYQLRQRPVPWTLPSTFARESQQGGARPLRAERALRADRALDGGRAEPPYGALQTDHRGELTTEVSPDATNLSASLRPWPDTKS